MYECNAMLCYYASKMFSRSTAGPNFDGSVFGNVKLEYALLLSKNVPKKLRKIAHQNIFSKCNSYKTLTSFSLSKVKIKSANTFKYANILNGPRSLFKNQYDYENVRFLPFH